MMGKIIEKDWITKAGLRAVAIVVLREDGTKRHRCGYVGVPSDNPYHGKEYDDEALWHIEVHGGLTYASKNDESKYPVESDGLWWFGFDCAHYGDGLIEESPMDFVNTFMESPRSLDYVETECERLAEQLNKRLTAEKE